MTSDTLFYCFIGAMVLMSFGIILLIANRSEKKYRKKSILPLLITGWSFVGLSVAGFAVAFIFYLSQTDSTSIFITLVLGGIFILGGIIMLLGFGSSSLVNGLRKDKEGKRNKDAIIRGSALLFLSIVVVATVIAAIMVLAHMESNKEKPIRMMVSLLWTISYLNVF